MEDISWSEPTCLVREVRRADLEIDREIVVEGSFADVASAFSRFPVEAWPDLTISFTERRRPPFGFQVEKFGLEILSQMIAAASDERRRFSAKTARRVALRKRVIG